MDEREKQLLRILRDALDTEPGDRHSLLDERCAGDEALRERVDAMLKRIAADPSEDAPATRGTIHRHASDDTMVGATLGSFQVLERIGRGGMGVVYRGARVDADYAQEVAIKLIRRGFDFDDVKARFLRERRILARLSHPNLARFIDAGVAADGRPWFALEFVNGMSIDAWCDRQRLDLRARVKLLIDVCTAAQYAHTQLVVHRDLKPGNVLVDASGTVRLLDFGVAGLLADDDDDARPSTIGKRHAITPEYAAPEQFTGAAVGVAADVYALGVIGYELLSGVLPYVLDRHDLDAAERSVRELPPMPLASAIQRSSRAASAAPHARTPAAETGATSVDKGLEQRLAMRRTSLRSYRTTVRGDLSRIFDKALQKLPEHRYQTAQAFADDLTRWLDGIPVQVTGVSARYRLSKFIGRNRMPVALATAAFVILIGGVLAVLWQSRVAVREAERANAVQTFLLSLFDANVPGGVADDIPSTRVLLDRGVERVQSEMQSTPELQAQMLTTLGSIYKQLRLFDQAEPLLQQALALQTSSKDADPLHLADTLIALGGTLREGNRHDEALPLLRRALNLVQGRDDEREIRARTVLAVALAASGANEEALAQIDAAIAALKKLGDPAARQLYSTLDDRAAMLVNVNRIDDAIATYQEAIAGMRKIHGDSHADIAQMLSNMGVAMLRAGRPKDAELPLNEAVAIDARVYAAPSPAQAVHLSNLASAVAAQGRLTDAEALYRRAMAIRIDIYGADSVDVAKTANNLASMLAAQEKFDEAAQHLSQSARAFRTAKGDWRYWIGITEVNLAHVLAGVQRYPEAETSARNAVAMFEATLGKDAEGTHDAVAKLAEILQASGRSSEALTLFNANLASSLQRADINGARLPHRYAELAGCELAVGDAASARAHYEKSLALALPLLGEASLVIINIRLGLADSLLTLNEPAAAATQLQAAADVVDSLPSGHTLRQRADALRTLLPK